MNIQIFGLSHKTAPIEIREKLAISSDRLTDALLNLKNYDSIEEGLILSTCNRVEIYTVVKDVVKGLNSIQSFISNFYRIKQEDIKDYVYCFSDTQAVRHLFRVVSSLDSMILGETQIFGQVKDAYFKARECDAAGTKLNGIFQEAIRTGKRVRTETQIGKGAVSVSSAAIELAKKIFENLEGKKALIIGAGKIGELVVKNLYSRGINTIVVANRSFQKAQSLAEAFRGEAVKFEQFIENMQDTDILISSTAAPHFILDKKKTSSIMQQRNYRPLFIIDLGVPRNIDPEVNQLENIYLYNIDDLVKVRDVNIKERLREAKKAEQIIEYHILQILKEIPQLCAQNRLGVKNQPLVA